MVRGMAFYPRQKFLFKFEFEFDLLSPLRSCNATLWFTMRNFNAYWEIRVRICFLCSRLYIIVLHFTMRNLNSYFHIRCHIYLLNIRFYIRVRSLKFSSVTVTLHTLNSMNVVHTEEFLNLSSSLFFLCVFCSQRCPLLFAARQSFLFAAFVFCLQRVFVLVWSVSVLGHCRKLS